MRPATIRRLIGTALLAGLALGAAAPAVGAQGVLERLKRAAEQAQKAAEARKKAEEARRATPPPSAPDAPATAPPSTAKVASEVLLTLEPGQQVSYVLSPQGQHVAAVVLRGSRQVLVYDGVDGPPFDEILGDINRRVAITFSPDGRRYGYVGRRGQEYIYMVDGKELARFPVASLVGPASGLVLTTEWAASPGVPVTTPPMFTSNGRHVYFVVTDYAQKRDGESIFHFDGQPGPRSDAGWLFPVFSPDGERYAYHVRDPNRSGQPALIVDGKPAAWQGDSPRFSGDSRHLVTSRRISGTAVEAQIDGKPWLRAADLRLHFAPVTNLVVAEVVASAQARGSFLHIGGQKVPGSESSEVGARVWFSADGQHWAAALRTAAGSQFMMIDGRKGLEYERVEAVTFLTDGTFVYKAVMPGAKHFIVTGDKESEAYQMIVSPDSGRRGTRGAAHGEDPFAVVAAGTRVGFIASRTPTAAGSVVVVDGQATPVPHPTELTFSPNGARVAFAFGKNPAASQVMVDGAAHSGMIVAAVPSEPSLTFSPDGKHLAYPASSIDQRQRGISVNGTFIPYASRLPNFPAQHRLFTPDSRHLIWLAGGFPQGRSAVYVDGMRAVDLDASDLGVDTSDPDALAAAWSMGAEGTLIFIAQDGAALKRFRVTPGADTSVETLMKLKALQ